MRFEDLDYSIFANCDMEIQVLVDGDLKDSLELDKVEMEDFNFGEIWAGYGRRRQLFVDFQKAYPDGEVGEITPVNNKLYIMVSFEEADWKALYE